MLLIVTLDVDISVRIPGDVDVYIIQVSQCGHQCHLGGENSPLMGKYPLGCRAFDFPESCSLNARFENAPTERKVTSKQMEESRMVHALLN